MKILRAEHLGMCFGVREAIDLAYEQGRRAPLTVLGDLVHNQTVISDLLFRGIRIAQRPEEVTTHNVMVTAHGASDRSIAKVRMLGLKVIEATCPLVHHAHRVLGQLVEDGFHPLIIGQHEHVEVRGMTGDLDSYDVVLTEKEILELRPRTQWGVVAQTTQPIDRVRHLVGVLRRRFPNAEVRFKDTVCRPTKERQSAAVRLAQRCDVVVVVGGASSNNTHELVRTCARHCRRVYHVQTAADLEADWFHEPDMVGVTAGTSTPDCVITGVEAALRRLSMTTRSAGVRAFIN